jgi:cAMP-dependent protein kinase regulator
MEKLEKQEFFDSKVKPIIDNLIFQLICEQPENVEEYVLDWLKKTGGYSTKNLTFDEKKELEQLRKDIITERDRKGTIDSYNETITNEGLCDEDTSTIDMNKMTIKPKKALFSHYNKFNPRKSFKARYIKKTQEHINRIQSKIYSTPLFSNLDPKDIELIIGALEEKQFERNESIIRQGEYADCMYLVETGVLECYKQVGKTMKMVKKYTGGDSFGEMALLYNTSRTASVVSKTNCILWELDRYTFNNLIKQTVRSKREEFESFLKCVSVFKNFNNYEVLLVCDALKPCRFNKGEYIIQEVIFC